MPEYSKDEQLPLDDSLLVQGAQQQTLKNKLMLEALRNSKLFNQDRVTQNPWAPQINTDNLERFANPNMAFDPAGAGRFASPQTLNLPLGDSFGRLALSPNKLKDFSEAAWKIGVQSPYESIKHLMTHGYTPQGDQGPKDIEGADAAAKVAFNLMGSGASRAALATESQAADLTAGFRAKIGRPSKIDATDTVMNSTLSGLARKYPEGTWGRQKNIINEFRKSHPEYQGSDATIVRHMYNVKPLDKDIEIGSFGGRGKLNTESPGEAINWLQSKRPVDEQFVRDWAKDANVPIRRVREAGQGTKYIELQNEYGPTKPGEVPPKIRIPGDEGAHLSPNVRSNEFGNLFDTGHGLQFPETGAQIQRPTEATTLNQAGMPFADREALDKALRWRMSKAPHGGNWLIPEEMAPRLPQQPKVVPTPEGPNPNQLKLLSNAPDEKTAVIARLMAAQDPITRIREASRLGMKNANNMPGVGAEISGVKIPEPANVNTKTLEQLNREAEARHQADMYRHALIKQGKDPTLFSNQSDPTTQAIIRIMQSKDPKTLERLNIFKSADQGKGNVQTLNTLPDNVNKKSMKELIEELLKGKE